MAELFNISSVGILVENDKVLMLKRHSHMRLFPSMWCLPGGKMEVGESKEECVIREFYEETGILVEIVGLIGLGKFVTDGTKRGMFMFLVRTVSKENQIGFPSEEHEAAAWISFDELDDYDIASTTVGMLKALKNFGHESRNSC